MAQGTLELKVNIDGDERVLKSVNDIKGAIGELQAKANSTSIGSKEFKETNAQILNLNGSLKQASTAAANSGGAFKAFKNGIGEAAGGVSMFGTSLSGVFKMLLTNPIGLIITAIVLLIQQLAKFESVTKPVTQLVQGLGAAFTKLIEPIANAIGKIVEAAVAIGEFFGVIDEHKVNEIDLFDKLDEQITNTIEKTQELSNESRALLRQSRDRTKTEEERIALIEEANKKEEEKFLIEKKNLELAAEAADEALKAAAQQGKDTDDLKRKRAEAHAAVMKAEADYLDLVETGNNRVKVLQDQALDEEKARQEEYKKIYEERKKAAIDAILAAQKNIRQIQEQILLDSITDEDERGRKELQIKKAYEVEKVQAEIDTLEAKKSLTKEEKEELAIKYDELKAIDQKYENERVQFVKSREDEQADYIQTKALETADVQIVAQQKVTDSAEKESKKRISIDKEEAEKNLRIAGQLTDSLISLNSALNDQYQADDSKTDAQKLAYAKRSFNREKALRIGLATIDGALAITSILGEYPKFDGGVAMIAALAAATISTGAAIAKIAATKFDDPDPGSEEPPKGSTYATGGIPGGIFNGPSHAQGGIPIEVEGGEAIINRNSTSMFTGLLSAINQAGGGKSFDNGVQSTTIPPVNIEMQPIIKTYVVSSDMTTQQEADAKFKQLARL